MDNHGPCITIEEDVKLTDNDNTQNTALKTPAYCSKDTAYRYYEFYYPKSYPKFDIPVFTLLYPPRYPTTFYFCTCFITALYPPPSSSLLIIANIMASTHTAEID